MSSHPVTLPLVTECLLQVSSQLPTQLAIQGGAVLVQTHHPYINLGRSRDGSQLFGCLGGWVGGSVCGCVSDPRVIQFALGSCYTVHINALSIELKCTSKGTTCKLN